MLIKPLTAVFNSGLPLGSTMTSGCCVGFCEGPGFVPIESISGVAPFQDVGFVGMCGGNMPTWVPNGFNSGYTMLFNQGCAGLHYPNIGAHITPIRTYYAVIKLYPVSDNLTGQSCSPCGIGSDAFYHGIRIVDGTLGFGRGGGGLMTGANSMGTMELVKGRWYAAAVAINDTPATGLYERLFYLYDLTANSGHPFSGQGGYINDLSSNGSGPGFPSFVIGANPIQEFVNPFEIYDAGIDGGTEWSSANFASYVADAHSFLRGTYTPTGTMQVCGSRLFESTDSTITVGAGRTIGIGAGGSGIPIYQWYRSLTSNFTPGAGNILVNGPNVSGANSTTLIDGSCLKNTPYFYLLQSIDGSTTLSYSQVAAILQNKPILRFGIMGDSLSVDVKTVQEMIRTCNARGRKVGLFTTAKAGTGMTGAGVGSWGTGVTVPAINEIQSLREINGTVTGGTFFLTDLLTSISTSSVPYNISIANLNSNLDYAFGAGSIVAAGGPLPGTPVSLTFQGGSYAGTARPLMWVDNSQLLGAGTLPLSRAQLHTILTTKGNAAGTSYSLYNQAVNLFLTDKVQWAAMFFGANDLGSTLQDYTNSYYSACSGLNQLGFNVVILDPMRRGGVNCDSDPSPVDNANLETLRQFGTAVESLSNGTNIISAGRNMYRFSLNNWQNFTDGTHPEGSWGRYPEGTYWMSAMLDAIDPTVITISGISSILARDIFKGGFIS